MIHVAQTGLSNNGENLNRRRSEQSNHGEQARHTRNFCEKLRKDNKDIAFQDLIDNFHKGIVTKDQLKEEFKKRLKKAPEEKRILMGITSDSDADIGDFLSKTKCFENQFMFQVQSDILAREKAQTEMIQDCVDVAHDEYRDFDEQELRDHLVRDMKTSPSRVKLFLESGKYRKTIIKKLPGSHALSTKSLGNVDFASISEAIGKLDPTNPKRREIQDAWLKINSIVEPGENLATAFARIMESNTPPAYLAGAYEAFFADSNTIISRENREKILNFLTRQYVPVVPLGVLESVDPKFAKSITVSESDKVWIKENPPADTELATALEKDKIEQWKKTRKSQLGGGTGLMSTRNVPFETKIRLLSQFGSIGKVEKMEDYYKGKPDSIRRSTMTEDDYKEEFSKIYGIEPANVETRTGLVTEIVTMLGKRIDGIEHFEDGCVMEWKTKTAEGEEMTGYYIIDQVPGEDPDEENMVSLRFLGNNKDPLSPAGIAMYYSGADFYHYLAGCSEDGRIQFSARESFEEKMKNNLNESRLPRYVNHEETYQELRKKFPEDINVDSEERLNAEIDQILNPNGEHPLEAKNKEDREIHSGMVLVAGESKIDTFQIKDIGNGTVTLWDGWGAGGNAQHEQTLTFREFILTIKNLKQKGLYRLNTNKKSMGTDEFNRICSDKNQYPEKENIFKTLSNVRITKNDNGVYELGKYNAKSGSTTMTPVIKIGEKKDIFIESIEADGSVRYRQGTFTQSKYDKEKDVWNKKPSFKGTGVRKMSLSNLWAHLCNNPSFELQKPEEKFEKKIKEEKSGSLSWWNVLMHTHSLGVILHGDLWKAPFKAWEEQHHKDHDFAGKMTVALAMEKLQNGGYGPISSFLNYTEFPTLMVADGNSSFQSYLDELVNKIDNMGSYHRTRLIKKWSTKEHFPSVKFMAAMMASMKIFGQLYPYDFGNDDYRNPDGTHEWFWYNSICHSLDPDHKKYPHMPPHAGEPWPKQWVNAAGYKMVESDVCFGLFGGFQHPMLKNLGRRYQKYMNKDHPELLNGGEMNLNMRSSMEDKLDWMMENITEKKIPESFGKATEIFLQEGYPVNVTSRPMAALLFGCRDQQMLAPTREHAKIQFQSGYHLPMLVFMQEQEHADIFRTAGVALAYTISMSCGAELERLVHQAEHNRLSGKVGKKWRKDFESFWSAHGDEMMYKLGGMRDPMLNLMINGPEVFDEMLDDQPPEKRAQYEKIRKHKDVLRAYYDRLAAVYDSPSHCEMKRGEGYYAGDHFRFRKGFPSGYGGIPWVNWDAYIDANLEDKYAAGQLGSTSGDGVFNEFRGFLYAIPEMAEKMATDMGFTDPVKKKKYTDKISRALYEKTISDNGGVGRLMKQKIDPTNPKAEYCSMTAMMFEIIPIQKLTKSSNSKEDEERFQRYFEQMELCLKRAKEIEQKDGFAAGMKYREKMAGKWSKIVKAETDTRKHELEQIEEADDPRELSDIKRLQENTQARSGTVLVTKLNEFESTARNNSLSNRTSRKNNTEDEMALSA